MVKVWGKGSFVTLAIASMLALSACSDSTTPSNGNSATNESTNSGGSNQSNSSENSSGSSNSSNTSTDAANTSLFPLAVKNDNEAIKGGILNYALVSDQPFEGVLNPIFADNADDFELINFFYPTLFGIDANYDIDDRGAAKLSISDDHLTATVTIDDKLNWTDGNPVTAEDYAFAFEVIGNKDYDGSYYDDTWENIVGMTEYHEGKADTISGIKVVNDKEVTISFKQPDPSTKAGLWSYPLEKKVFGNIAVKDMSASDGVRKNPVGYGAFKIKSIVPGESIEYAPNEDYFRGAPKLDAIHLKVVNPAVITESLKTGDVDIASLPTSRYDEKTNPQNVQILGDVQDVYSYLGFKLGKYDKTQGLNIMDPNAKMGNKSLRQAMGYAMNNDQVGEQIYHNLRFRANSPIPPVFAYHDNDLVGYNYDPEKAKQLLDEAGYKDVDGDGLREDPQGNKFVVHYAAMSGDTIAEAIANFYLQNWKDVGLDVELVDGKLLDMTNFYDRVKADDPAIDIFGGAWQTGSNVDPSGVYSASAFYNYPRFVSDENTKLLKEGVSPEAFDPAYRSDVYKKWQDYIVDQAVFVPTLYRYGLEAVNNRVKNFDIKSDGDYDLWAHVELTSDKPEVK